MKSPSLIMGGFSRGRKEGYIQPPNYFGGELKGGVNGPILVVLRGISTLMEWRIFMAMWNVMMRRMMVGI